MIRLAASLGLLLATTSVVLAHAGHEHEPPPAPRNWGELWTAWAFEPLVVIPLALSAWLYARGTRRLWRDAGPCHGVTYREAACFAGGWLALVAALVSPVHPWGGALFAAHMAQHEILMLVAAPLLVLVKPVVAFLKALPAGWAKRLIRLTHPGWFQAVWGFVTNPFVAWLVHAAVLWVWHIPALFHSVLTNEAVHALQHASFLFSALLFWWAVLHAQPRALGYGAGVLYPFTTAVHSGLLGALITLASAVWYPDYLTTTQSWGLSPLEDQQLGGLVMWVPACSLYIVAGLILFAGWLRSSEERVRRWEAADREVVLR